MFEGDESDALLGSLRELTDRPGGKEFNRGNILALLDALASHLERPLAKADGTLDDGTLVLLEHPAVTLLRNLSSAIEDLDKGLTDEVLKPISYGANNTRRWRLRAQDEAVIDLIAVTSLIHAGRNKNTIIRELARNMRKGGYLRQGKQVGASQMRGIWNRHKKQ